MGWGAIFLDSPPPSSKEGKCEEVQRWARLLGHWGPRR